MQRHVLGGKEAALFLKSLNEKYGLSFNGRVEVGKERKQIYYFLDGVLAFYAEELVPTLCALSKFPINLGFVRVDEGAAKALIRGADLFVPGIKEYGCKCTEGEIVAAKLRDSAVAIIKVLKPKERAQSEAKGKFGLNLHHIGDEIWKMCRQ